ncbi:MAG: single-stranded DNA-binding protein [bacterium]
MSSFNKAVVLGYLGKDSELKSTQNGNSVASFSVATSETFKNKEGVKTEKTTWHNIQVWGKTAEALSQYLTKGTRVLVEGKISNRSYDKQDGTKGYISEIIANNIVLLGNGNSSGTKSIESAPAETENYTADGDDENIPF